MKLENGPAPGKALDLGVFHQRLIGPRGIRTEKVDTHRHTWEPHAPHALRTWDGEVGVKKSRTRDTAQDGQGGGFGGDQMEGQGGDRGAEEGYPRFASFTQSQHSPRSRKFCPATGCSQAVLRNL